MKNLLFSLITFVTFVPVAVFAQQNLVNLPIGETGDFSDYINAVYLMFISIAALIAVIKIIIAGVKYMFSDIVTQKSEAKRDIQGALLGLLVVLAAVVVLTIINPDLTTFDPDISRIQERVGPPPASNLPSEVDQMCIDGEGCVTQQCDALDDYTGEMILAGATVGLVAPGIGSLAGIVVGGATGLILNYQGTEAQCNAVCAWLEGTRVGDTCVSPNNALAVKAAELERTRAELAIQYDCEDGRLIMLGGEFSNCIRDISPEVQSEIITNLGVSLNTEAQTEVITQMTNFAIQDAIVNDQTIIDSLSDELGATSNVLVVEIPTNVLSPRRMELDQAVEGVCRTIATDTNQNLGIAVVDRGTSSYIVCGQ